ncbi:MAG: FMN-binding protein, partial [Odoribacter sp.]|nr:FMN-binding protein [Odoribacter sp.]
MSIKENVAVFVTKLPKVLLLCLIIYLISLNFKVANGEHCSEQTGSEISVELPLEAVKKYFPASTAIERIDDVRYDVKADQQVIGKLLVTTPIADDLIGYAGNVPLFLAVSNEEIILGLTLLDNSESPGFLRRIGKKNLLSAWNGKTLEEAAQLEVEAVSGATMSSDAIRGSVKRALAFHLKRAGGTLDLDWMKLLQHVLGGGVVLLALASMFLGGRMKRWRYVLQ